MLVFVLVELSLALDNRHFMNTALLGPKCGTDTMGSYCFI